MKWLLMLFLLIGSVYAVDMDDACVAKGFANTVSSWVWNNETYIEIQNNNFNLTLNGTARKAYWNSTSQIDGVVYKTGSRTYLLDGGFSGQVPRTTTSNDIQWIVFCSNNEVPEFPLIGVVLALLIAGLIYRKINK
ncbi:TPA: hypothetical protein HA371_06420 [Candidatus Woesearchaeota archaeon]|nr:hypothetical protein [Candidatus Woesearchaeota archaeon]